MRRELILAPELLSDERLDALEKLAAALIDQSDGGSGSDIINDEIAATLGASVAKAKQCIGKLITVGIVRHEIREGNKRLLFSQLLAYRAMRRSELGWSEPDDTPTIAPPMELPATPATAAAHPPADPPVETTRPTNGNGLFGDALIPIDQTCGPTNDEIWGHYPRKIEKKASILAIAAARKRLAKRLKDQGERQPMRAAGEKLLERTRLFGELWRERLERNPADKQWIKHGPGWFDNDLWDDDAYEDWSSNITAHRARGPRGGSLLGFDGNRSHARPGGGGGYLGGRTAPGNGQPQENDWTGNTEYVGGGDPSA